MFILFSGWWCFNMFHVNHGGRRHPEQSLCGNFSVPLPHSAVIQYKKHVSPQYVSLSWGKIVKVRFYEVWSLNPCQTLNIYPEKVLQLLTQSLFLQLVTKCATLQRMVPHLTNIRQASWVNHHIFRKLKPWHMIALPNQLGKWSLDRFGMISIIRRCKGLSLSWLSSGNLT